MKKLLIPAALLLAAQAQADESFRCGNYIASSSMSVQELLTKCGSPSSKSRSAEDVMVRNPNGTLNKSGETLTETWIYDRGSNAPAMVVTIVDGRIRSITRQR